jgi:hypothetical protein
LSEQFKRNSGVVNVFHNLLPLYDPLSLVACVDTTGRITDYQFPTLPLGRMGEEDFSLHKRRPYG